MELSFEAASKLYTASCIFILVGLVVGVIATGFSLYAGKIKEQYLSVELEKTKLEAAKANERTEQIKKEMSRRRLSEQQYNILVSKLTAYPTKLEIYHPQDIEAATFAEDILRALKGAGWEVKREAYIVDNSIDYSIRVSRTDNDDSARLLNALNSINITTILGAPKDVFRLVVGSKPPPTL